MKDNLQRKISRLRVRILSLGITPEVYLGDDGQVVVDVDVLEKLTDIAEKVHTGNESS